MKLYDVIKAVSDSISPTTGIVEDKLIHNGINVGNYVMTSENYPYETLENINIEEPEDTDLDQLLAAINPLAPSSITPIIGFSSTDIYKEGSPADIDESKLKNVKMVLFIHPYTNPEIPKLEMKNLGYPVTYQVGIYD